MYICRTNPFAMLNDVNDVLNDELVKSSLAASKARVLVVPSPICPRGPTA